MIIKGLLELIFGLLQIVFAPINLPDLPEAIQNVLDGLVDVLGSAVGLFAIFFDMSVVRVLIPLVIVIVNFERVWNLILFILRKIPFIGIE